MLFRFIFVFTIFSFSLSQSSLDHSISVSLSYSLASHFLSAQVSLSIYKFSWTQFDCLNHWDVDLTNEFFFFCLLLEKRIVWHFEFLSAISFKLSKIRRMLIDNQMCAFGMKMLQSNDWKLYYRYLLDCDLLYILNLVLYLASMSWKYETSSDILFQFQKHERDFRFEITIPIPKYFSFQSTTKYCIHGQYHWHMFLVLFIQFDNSKEPKVALAITLRLKNLGMFPFFFFPYYFYNTFSPIWIV